MHLVVARYVKPWTKQYHVGLALMLNAGHIAKIPGKKAEEICKADVFVSHTWNERFEDFASTLHRSLDADTVVWVCSFALNQNGNIAEALGDFESCPFAAAMKAAKRVLVASDSSADVLTRCWVVLELHFATLWQKPYDICLVDNADKKLCEDVGTKLENIDVNECEASHKSDKDAIIEYAQRKMGIDALNTKVKDTARVAMKRSKLMAAAASNDIGMLTSERNESKEEWTGINGQTLVHVAAQHNSITTLEYLVRTIPGLLHASDQNDQTPLIVSAIHGAAAGVHALLSLKADPDHKSKSGRTALHESAISGFVQVSQLLLESRASVESLGSYQGFAGHRPMSLASWNGHTELVRILIERKAKVHTKPRSDSISPLHMAVYNGHAETASTLIAAKAHINSTAFSYGRTPLMLAVQHGHVGLVGALLSLHADPNIPYYHSHDGKSYGLDFLVKWCKFKTGKPKEAENISSLLLLGCTRTRGVRGSQVYSYSRSTTSGSALAFVFCMLSLLVYCHY